MPILAHIRLIVSRPLFVLLGALALSLPSPGHAQSAEEEAGFQAYLRELGIRARTEGVSDTTITRMTRGLTVNPRVIALDRSQPGSGNTAPPPVAPYLQTHVNPTRIAGGKKVMRDSPSVLREVEARYNVPAQILVAIWGHETNYGSYTGDFDLARSLATLAYEGRRRELFADEFIALLKMVDMGVSPSLLKGSWAGAFGNPQFLPSVYLRLAVDYDGNGTRDIWNSTADTLASVANYFRDAGWRPGDPWGVPASVPAGFNWDQVRTRMASPRCDRVHARHSAWKTINEWRALGVIPQRAVRADAMASLFQPDGAGKPAWLITGNYRSILEYNCSNYYALSVGLLADRLEN